MTAPSLVALNRTILARQLLLERSSFSLPKALEQIGGIQAQYAPSMYIGLWSRVEGFERGQLDAALVDRTVVQGTLMCATIHLVSAADYWPLALAVRASRQAWWLRVQRVGVTEAEMEELASRARQLFIDGPVHHVELEAAVGRERLSGLHLFLDIVRVPPSGTWVRRRANVYALADDWLGPPPDLAVGAAIDHAVRRYRQGFGPAAPRDIASWAGLPIADVRASCLRVGDEVNESGDLVDLPGGGLVDAGTPAPVRFLPTWDAGLLAHARRAGLVREEDRARIFMSRNPQSLATFTVDGVVAGAWRLEGERIVVDPFRPLLIRDARAVAVEAERVAELHR